MSGLYPSFVGGDYGLSQFQEQIGDFLDPYWSPEYPPYDESPYGLPSDFPAGIDSDLPTPVSGLPDLDSPLEEFDLFVEGGLAEDMFFPFDTPPADTISPADLTPTTPRSPDTIASSANLSPTTPRSPDILSSPFTPRSPDTDGSRASTNPTTPGSADPENYEPAQIHTGGWKCTYPRCPRHYRRRCDVNKHCKTHTKPFACSTCGQKSSSKRDKERHELSHRSEHPKCPHPSCSNTTSRKDNMRDHIKRKHKDMDPKDPIIDELYSKRPRIQ